MDLPERLGKYPVSGVLGKGAMGVVYRAFDPVIRRPVAIKTIRRELIEDDDKAEMLAGRFRKEAQAAGALNHPGIVSVYEYGETDEYAYIAMECVEGNSLREYFARGARFDERDAVSIIAQLLDALEYAHNHSVWHRDIKPANIIIMGNGRIKLTDFGIARIDSVDRTHTNMLMGTPGYIAPEYYLGQPTDHRADIFSAGVVFYHLLTGASPFKGTPEAIMHSVCYHDPDPPSRAPNVNVSVRNVFDAVVARALMKRPEDRFPSTHAFRTAVLAAYDKPVAETVSEATIITEIARTPSSGETPSAGARATPTGGSTPPSLPPSSTPPPTGWDALVLGNVERELARFLGPVARVLVRRSAREHTSVEGLAIALTAHLTSPDEREAFLKKIVGRTTMTPAAKTVDPSTTRFIAGPNDAAPSEQDLERLGRVLTSYIGPIAKVLVKRTAQGGITRRELAMKLAESIPAEADRARFLRDAGV